MSGTTNPADTPGSAPGNIDTATYRMSLSQRRTLHRWSTAMGLVAATFLGITASQGFDVYALPFWMVVGLVIVVVVYLNVASGRTIVDAVGIRAQRPLSRHTYPWDCIAEVAVKTETSRDGDQYRVVIRTVQGRERRLPAPGTFGIWHDPEFGAHSARIIAAWEQRCPAR